MGAVAVASPGREFTAQALSSPVPSWLAARGATRVDDKRRAARGYRRRECAAGTGGGSGKAVSVRDPEQSPNHNID